MVNICPLFKYRRCDFELEKTKDSLWKKGVFISLTLLIKFVTIMR